MAKEYIMALDQGTTSSRCIIFDKKGNIISMGQREFPQIYPKPGWVEHDALTIWDSQLEACKEALEKSDVDLSKIDSIGITNQRETTILWDKKTGEPICNAIVWQCRRTARMIDQCKADGFDTILRQRTGLIPDAYFSATKIAWILNHVEGARERAENGELLFGTVDTWLIYRLTGGKVHATDYTNASRTMLFDIHRLCWDEDILAYFKIPSCILPEVFPSGHGFGETDEKVLGAQIPIAGVAGDQQAALFGQCCFEAGQVKNTYGTGCFMLMNTGHKAVTSKEGLLTTIAAGTDNEVQYVLEGSVFVAGAAIQWLRDSLEMIIDAPTSEKLARSVEDTAGVYLVPAFTGLGAPYWDPEARGTMLGMTRGCTKAHVVRAALESIAYQTVDVLRAMVRDGGLAIRTLKVDGGASANDFLMQFQADVLGTRVERPQCIETTALGVAYLAGLTTGYYKNKEEIKENWQLGIAFTPQMSDDKRVSLLNNWKRAVKTALYWSSLSDQV